MTLRKRSYVTEEQGAAQRLVREYLGGDDTLKKLVRVLGADKQSISLAKAVVRELAKRLDSAVDRDFEAAVGRLRTAARQSGAPDSARNLVFKAANELGMKLPSMMF